MASINDRRQVGQEIVYRVRSTGSGYKVIRFDGSGLADGIMSKRNCVYKYGDDAEEKAVDSAYRYAEDAREKRDVPVTVVEPGEVMAEKLSEDDSDE